MSPPGSGCVVVAEMSTAGCLISSDYIESVLKMAAEYNNVIGLVCQRKLSDREDLIYMTPGVCVCVCVCNYYYCFNIEGVNFNAESDPFGQQYNSPEEVRGTHLDRA